MLVHICSTLRNSRQLPNLLVLIQLRGNRFLYVSRSRQRVVPHLPSPSWARTMATPLVGFCFAPAGFALLLQDPERHLVGLLRFYCCMCYVTYIVSPLRLPTNCLVEFLAFASCLGLSFLIHCLYSKAFYRTVFTLPKIDTYRTGL